jgi:hypothetical protein
MIDQRGMLKPRVIPGLVVLCIYLALTLYQNALVMRFALAVSQQGVGDFQGITSLYVAFALIELALAFAAIMLLALVRQPFVPWFAAAALLLVGQFGRWLENLLLAPYRPDRPIIELNGAFDFLELVIVVCGAVWLLKSRNVRDFYDRRLLARTFE